MDHPPSSVDDPRLPKPVFNPFWILLVVTGALFCLTVFVCVAGAFADADSPLRRLFGNQLVTVLLIEVGCIVALAFLAMAVDQRTRPRQ